MPVRLTGMVSGMDTDTLIQQLVSAKRTKVDNVRGKKTKLECELPCGEWSCWQSRHNNGNPFRCQRICIISIC